METVSSTDLDLRATRARQNTRHFTSLLVKITLGTARTDFSLNNEEWYKEVNFGLHLCFLQADIFLSLVSKEVDRVVKD